MLMFIYLVSSNQKQIIYAPAYSTDAMELRSQQLGSNFCCLFPTSPSSMRPNASIVSQVIHNTPPATTRERKHR